MKRVFRIAVLSIFTLALTTVAIPAQAAEHGYDREQDYRHAHYVPNDRYHGNDRDYDNRYLDYCRDNHAGRSAAIIGGSAAAGALIGAAADRGQGAAIGAIIGGIGGFIADQSVRHHDRR
jgi:hypothetical protein